MSKTYFKLRRLMRHYFHPQRSNNHRAKILHAETFFALSLAIGAIALLLQNLLGLSSLAHVLGFSSSITPEQVVLLTNQERKRLGLSELVVNQDLVEAALAKGQNMFSEQYWAHVSPEGTEPWDFMQSAGYSYVVAGENLARDFSTTDQMVAAWMDSPTHRANIINNKYNEIGIAVIDGVLQGTETTLVVQMFGNRGGVVSPTLGQSGQVASQAVVAEENLSSEVLAGALVYQGALRKSPLFSPLQLSKAIILAASLMVIASLAYDLLVIGNRRTMRIVGNNLAHICLLIMVSFLVIFFKAGVIG